MKKKQKDKFCKDQNCSEGSNIEGFPLYGEGGGSSVFPKNIAFFPSGLYCGIISPYITLSTFYWVTNGPRCGC